MMTGTCVLRASIGVKKINNRRSRTFVYVVIDEQQCATNMAAPVVALDGMLADFARSAQRTPASRSGYHAFAASREDGLAAEREFKQWVASTGEFRIVDASTTDRRKSHWGVLIERAEDSLSDPTRKRLRVDVKDCKAAERHDTSTTADIWIELCNSFGAGWLFGDADVIAFKQPDATWLLVERDSLAEWVMNTLDSENPHLYTNENRAAERPPSLSWVYCRASRFNGPNVERITTANVEDIRTNAKTYSTVSEWFTHTIT